MIFNSSVINIESWYIPFDIFNIITKTFLSDLFFFGLKTLNGKVVVGNGTDELNFNACFTSMKLLKRLENLGQFHVDCT